MATQEKVPNPKINSKVEFFKFDLKADQQKIFEDVFNKNSGK